MRGGDRSDNRLIRRASWRLAPIWISYFIFVSVKARTLPSSASTPLSYAQIPDVFQVSATMPASSPGAEGRKENGVNSRKNILMVAIVVSLAIAAVMLLLFSWVYRKWISVILCSKKREDAEKGSGLDSSHCKLDSWASSAMIDYKQLETATNAFDDCNILGTGGFGCVYKGQINENFYVAVKKLDDCSDSAEREFKNEVDLLKKIQHPNIISLLGYCVRDNTKLLVYELMHNGSLETHLHGPSHGSALNWHARMRIALDIARGLEHLHEYCNPRVIHRDLKSSNILLDSNFCAKISDFGLAVVDGPQNSDQLPMSGTLGYAAPEYLLDGKLTEKSDVYAFGVVLLELILGRKPVERLTPSQCQSIVTWAMPQLKDRSKLPNIVDPVIRDMMDLKHLYQVAAVAVLCVQPEPSYRPLITDVLHSLIPLVPIELGGALRVAQSDVGN